AAPAVIRGPDENGEAVRRRHVGDAILHPEDEEVISVRRRGPPGEREHEGERGPPQMGPRREGARGAVHVSSSVPGGRPTKYAARSGKRGRFGNGDGRGRVPGVPVLRKGRARTAR